MSERAQRILQSVSSQPKPFQRRIHLIRDRNSVRKHRHRNGRLQDRCTSLVLQRTRNGNGRSGNHSKHQRNAWRRHIRSHRHLHDRLTCSTGNGDLRRCIRLAIQGGPTGRTVQSHRHFELQCALIREALTASQGERPSSLLHLVPDCRKDPNLPHHCHPS